MKKKTLKLLLWVCSILTMALSTSNASVQTVTTIGGGAASAPYSGYVDGNTLTQAKFRQPYGLAMDPGGNHLFVADYSNNAVRCISNPGNTNTSTTSTFSNSFAPAVNIGISHPVSVILDSFTNLYVLNQGNGTNGTVLKFNAVTNDHPSFLMTNASGLINATAMAMDGLTNLYVTVSSNTVLRISPSDTISVVGLITNAGTCLQGIAVMDDGKLALSDAGTNSGIWLMNPEANSPSNNVTKLAGFNGAGYGNNTNNLPEDAAYAYFNHPGNIAKAGNGILIVADNNNNRVRLLNTISNTVTLFYGVNSNYWGNPKNSTDLWPGWLDGSSGALAGYAESRLPYGVVVAPDGSVFVAEDYYHVLRHITSTGLTAPKPGFPPLFNNPAGIALDYAGANLFIADQANNAVRMLNFGDNSTTTYLTAADGISNPASVLLDTNDNLYVLNQKAGTNGNIIEFDPDGYPYDGVVSTGLNQPTAFTIDGNGNLFIAEQGGAVKVVLPSGLTSTITTIATNTSVSLQGIAIMDNGLIAVSDADNHVIWTINPITKTISLLTGQFGNPGNSFGRSQVAKLNQPHQLARSGTNILVADYGNNRLGLVSINGYLNTNSFNSSVATLWFGNANDPSTNSSAIPMVGPSGVAVSSAGLVYVSEPPNADIRGLTTNLAGATTAPIVNLPYYSSLAGIALNYTNSILYVADPTNDTVSALDLVNNTTSLFLNSSNGINQPVDVAVDSSDNVYVLNQGTGGNGSILEFDKYGNLLGTNASALSLPTAMKLSFAGNLYVAELNGAVQEFNSSGSNTLAIVNNTNNVQLQGIALLDNGSVVVSDAGNHVLWKISPSATNAVLFTGNLKTPGAKFGANTKALLNTPLRLAQASGGLLLIADSGNNRVVVCDDSGTISSALNSTNATLWFGNSSDPVGTSSPNFVPMFAPAGIAIGNGGTVFVSEEVYKDIRGLLNTGISAPIPPPSTPLNLVAMATAGQINLTWSASTGATNYNVKRSTSSGGSGGGYYPTIGSTSTTSFTDTNVLNGSTYYYVVSAVNGGGESLNSSEVSVTPPYLPVPTPQIGYVDFPATATPEYTSVFHPVPDHQFYNDGYIVIKGTPGSGTYYTVDGTTPTTTNSSVPSDYQDGITTVAGLQSYLIQQVSPSFTIKTLGAETNHPSSAVVQATFEFITGNPSINGNNAGQFFISDITANAHLYYTIDGSIPSATNGVDLGTVATPTNVWTVGLSITTNTLFQVVAVRPNYQPSAVVNTTFSATNFTANVISFGFGSGEASSDFVASPGQTFYAPVTLSLLPNTTIYGMQFNLTVTNGGPNPGPAIAPGSFGFSSMLMKPIPGVTPVVYEPIPPAMFVSFSSINPNPVLLDGSTNFTSLTFTNSGINLLGVGWVERAGATNLYDTTKQDLIQYSMAHDDLFPNAKQPNEVIVGGYAFQVPGSATNGQTYQIQIGRPSANSDGVGAPDSAVYISASTIGSTADGLPLNALKYVTVGQKKYIAGDVYPFYWFNAGDFGTGDLFQYGVNDVEQVFEAAIYGLNSPKFQAPGSDFFDAMDSCGGTYVDLGHGYLEFNSYVSGSSALNPLFSGDDTSINQIAFGDGVLDVCDVYVTFRRTLDSSLVCFQRYWNNGQRVAQIVPNSSHVAKAASTKVQDQSTSTVSPQVNFTAGDITNCTAGQVLQIPIAAAIYGSYPLRVLMLNLTVVPLDGSPALTTPISFSPNPVLGQPNPNYTLSPGNGSLGNGNWAAAWLPTNTTISSIPGLSNNVTLGTLTLTIPANATSVSAYAIHFDHASASPNGFASFPKQMLTGLITLSSRTNSSYNDAIPDSWRLRWFGTVNNLLSASNNCPTGDGVNNWKKYVAGVDPNTANDFPSVKAKTSVPSGYSSAIHWPTVAGKKYVIERSSSLFSGSWTTNANIITGTGADMEYDDNTGGTTRFYRVQILQ